MFRQNARLSRRAHSKSKSRTLLNLEQFEDRVMPTVTLDVLNVPYSANEGDTVRYP